MRRNKLGEIFSAGGANGPIRTDGEGPLDADRHPRYLSEWESNVVEIDISHQNATEVTVRLFDLSNIHITRAGASSQESRSHLSLNFLPEFQNSLKAGINATLYVRTDSIADSVSGFINTCRRFFAWLIHRGIYRLSQVTHQDTRELGESWPKDGWWGLLDYDGALRRVLDAAKSDNALAMRLQGYSNTANITLNAVTLSEIIGLPLSANQIPLWFIEELGTLLNFPSAVQNRSPRPWETTRATYSRLMVEVNRLSFLPTGFDMIPFLPYPNSNADATTRFPNTIGRTKNISISDAVKILTEALKWIYDYKSLIMEVANATRDAVEYVSDKGFENEEYVRKATAAAFKSAIARTGISLPLENPQHSDLKTLITALQTAAFCIVTINLGRRQREITGQHKPYGLYFGCLNTVSNIATETRIDIYVAKSVRQYVSFWCNPLVIDAVRCLEELSQVFRPLKTSLKQYPGEQAMGRSDKLFYRRHFTVNGFKVEPTQFDFARTSAWFFQLAGVSPEYVYSRAHPFRRIFGLLYKYRYDRFKLGALSEHYRHDSFSTTEIYLTDAPGVSPADGVEFLYAPALANEVSDLRKTLDEIEKEYVTDLIERLLNGELMGGIFPKLILSLMKRLSASVEYREQSDEIKSNILQTHLIRRGYVASEKEHGVCCCTQTSRTKARSNCYSDGEIHPENASPNKCGGCLHLLTTPGYRKHLALEAQELQAQQEDYSLPPAVRLEARKNATLINDYIRADEQTAIETQWSFNNIVDRWEPIFFCKN
ncbi:hypothetical protein [Massilia brevitalea]|uniref:hypothetical protein n=1 Tax=Massilia brevitalea TaxID=442526 RepID=UPI002738A194|nr:hypothetical protein [Massilia brevitalea]